jgi:hypothetical protein
MIKKLVVIILSMSLLLVTSGCSTHIHPAIGLPFTEPGYQSAEVSIAVDYFGVKHIARTECPISGTDPCKLIYTRVKPGLPGLSETAYSWLPVAGQNVYDVDIAVTDGGRAFIVFRWDGQAGATVSSELYLIRSDVLGVLIPVETTYAVHGKPIAVSRGGNIYVAYEVQSSTYSQIRYRMLNNPGVGGWVDTCFSTAECILHDAAVGWSGYLYVTYAQADYLEYADNYGVSGDMTNHVYVSTYFSSKADIDINGNPEMVYLIYDDTREFPGFSNGLFINYCLANSCTSMTIAVIPMADAELWRLQGNPQVIADTVTTAYYIFTATHVSSPNINVYTGGFQVGVTPAAPTQVTDTPGTEGDVRICLMWSVIPVTGWRMDLGGGFFGDIFQDALTSGKQKVRVTTTGAAEIDMACNADWGAGIWNEETGIGIQALVSFNTYPVMMPLIRK